MVVLMEEKPRVIDAKYKMVRGPGADRPWWRRLYIDWQNAVLVGGVSLALALKAWLEH